MWKVGKLVNRRPVDQVYKSARVDQLPIVTRGSCGWCSSNTFHLERPSSPAGVKAA